MSTTMDLQAPPHIAIAEPGSLDSVKRGLRPTTTIVRNAAILCHGWEEAAIENVVPATKEKLEEIHKPSRTRREIMAQLQVDAQSWREKLDSSTSLGAVSTRSKAKEDTLPSPPKNTETQHHLSGDWMEMHGFRGSSRWTPPVKVAHCEVEARPGYASRLAHEYEDTPEVLIEKVKLLAKLVRESRNCLLYIGAGISTSSGINDYASKTPSTNRPKLCSPYEAQPTMAHRALVAMHKAHFVHYWIQQNHDGLPQKAGLPQECINEIHGAWYDPSNPVVPMQGSLRRDLFLALLHWEQKTDLTLSMGTSMCGMNSDRVFTTVATRGKEGSAIGGVIINIQQTQFDHLSCLRIFAKLDKVMLMLCDELGLVIDETAYVPDIATGATGEDDVFYIPYDQDGNLILRKNSKPNQTYQTLNLKIGQKLRLTDGPYKGDEGEVLGKNREGHYRIQFMHVIDHSDPIPQPRPFETVLGSWWIEAVVKGNVPRTPIVNIG